MLDYGMTEYDAGVLTAEVADADYFEAVARGRDGKQAANWVINELFGRLNKEGLGVEASPIDPGQLGGLIDLVASGEISGKIAKDVFEILWTEGGDPATIVAERGLRQVTDVGAIEAAVDAVIAANPDKVAQARDKPTMAGWFVGQVMKATGGKANPQAVDGLVKARLGLRMTGEGAMTFYDYKVTPAPKQLKRIRGVSATADLFAATLAEAINAAAREGWEYRPRGVAARDRSVRLVPAWLGGDRDGAGVPPPARDHGAAARRRARRGRGRFARSSARWSVRSSATPGGPLRSPRWRGATPGPGTAPSPGRRCAPRPGWVRPTSSDKPPRKGKQHAC